MFQVKNNLCPIPVKDIFNSDIHSYDLRNKKTWEVDNVRTVTYGTETVRHRGPKIWDIIPTDIKASTSLYEFKRKIKMWNPVGCTCRICRTYIAELGFIN